MARRAGEHGGTQPPDERDSPQASAAADLEATIAEHAIRLAHMFYERARMFLNSGDSSAAVRDKSRAESLWEWAAEAAKAANTAGREVLDPELEQLKNELTSFEIGKSAKAR